MYWVIVGYVLLSAGEYFAHRYFMHRPLGRNLFTSHTIMHHSWFRSSFTECDEPLAAEVSIETGPFRTLFAAGIFWLPLYFYSHVGAEIIAIMAFTHGAMWSMVHREMHFPTGCFERSWLYRFWRQYHQAHHINDRTHFNVLCPGADWLMRTL